MKQCKKCDSENIETDPQPISGVDKELNWWRGWFLHKNHVIDEKVRNYFMFAPPQCMSENSSPEDALLECYRIRCMGIE